MPRFPVACILVRALGESQLADANARALTKFPDDHDIAGWARGCVFTALQQGIVHGYPDNTFGPGHETSRAEVCTIIGNFLNTLQAE